MAEFLRTLAALALGGLLAVANIGSVSAADERLYPSGPPNGVGYLRFANLTAHEVTVVSASARIALPPSETGRVRRYDPVTPGSELNGTVQEGGKSAPIKVTLTANEFVTVVVTNARDGALSTALLRETPSDFNAAKSSIALYNMDEGCGDARLTAGDKQTPVIGGVAPGASGRRLVNPVDVALAVACSEATQPLAAKLGPLAAGERYSVFIFAPPAMPPQIVALRDESAPLRP